MSRTHLLGAASAVALMLASPIAFAQESTTNIQGGGSTLAAADYLGEFSTFDNSQPSGAAKFLNADYDTLADAIYWPVGSGTGQSAFLDNNLNEECIKQLGAGSSYCANNTPAGPNAVQYGASDATFSTTQITSWATSAYGANTAGHLIQLPSMGVGISIPVINSLVTANGASAKHKPLAHGITLTEDDLCGIFSGKIYDWSQTSVASKVAAGLITVVYRNDGSGTSFLLLNHFVASCNATNSNFPTLPVVPSTTFTSVFVTGANPTGAPPIPPGQTVTNFLGEKGSSGIANTLSGLTSGVTLTSAIAYLTPDFTSVDPMSDARLSNGAQSTLVVAGVAAGSLTYVPYVADVAVGLNHGAIFNPAGPTKPPTSASAGAQTAAYVPLIETVSAGYPIVGYTTFDLAQCYASSTITSGVLAFLTDHYSTQTAYKTIINRNGFVPIVSSGAHAFSAVIQGAILTNTKKWNDNIGSTAACGGLTGR